MKIEIDDQLVAKARQDLLVSGHLAVSEEELGNFFKYNSEIVVRSGIARFYERWLKILEKRL